MGLIPPGHKMATRSIETGMPVRRYGQIIGFAKEGIAPGDWVHEHNCSIGEQHGAFERDYAFSEGVVPVEFVADAQRATFQGFRRANGTVDKAALVAFLKTLTDEKYAK